MINHGTRSGYYAHRRLSEPPCDECREAINEYIRDYRSRTGLARNRAGERLRRRALAALRDRHREEYEEILYELRAEEE
jgi:hypothetical protein